MVTAMILCYFIKRKKPIFELIAVIVLHAGYNFLIINLQ